MVRKLKPVDGTKEKKATGKKFEVNSGKVLESFLDYSNKVLATDEMVLAFGEKYLVKDKIKESRTLKNYNLEDGLTKRIDRIALETGITSTQLLTNILRDFFDTNKVVIRKIVNADNF